MVFVVAVPATDTTEGPPVIVQELSGNPPLFEGSAQTKATEVPVDVAEIALGAPGIETAFLVLVPTTAETPDESIQRTSTE